MDFADDPLSVEFFLHLPLLLVYYTNPTDYLWIFIKQNENKELLQWQKNFLTNISLKSLMTKNSFAMLNQVMTETCSEKLPWPTWRFGPHCTGSMQCLDTLAHVGCVWLYKPDITIHICICILNNSYVKISSSKIHWPWPQSPSWLRHCW